MAAWTHAVTGKVLGMAALALLMTIPLLVTVALMMYLTRRIDWYAYVPTYVPSAAVPAVAVPSAAPEPPPPAGIMARP